MKPSPRRTRRSVIREANNEPEIPMDKEFPHSPDALRFNFHIGNKTTRESQDTKKRSKKKSKGSKKTR